MNQVTMMLTKILTLVKMDEMKGQSEGNVKNQLRPESFPISFFPRGRQPQVDRRAVARRQTAQWLPGQAWIAVVYPRKDFVMWVAFLLPVPLRALVELVRGRR